MNGRPLDDPTAWMTATQAAAHLAMSRRGLYAAIRRGQVRAHRLGRRLRFRRRDLDEALRK